ncbi:hypothetical protein AKJ48_01435 [candidate division MSBL1 archaeon SCGC-AAA261O19]|uniref:YprB ribonuclease H-like domain-containing protein n=1 Tax=candidate division MSBL1 archaeon SCGC-AAA261O19 TaxID=1698277 RepID=A0A133VEC7_9EURY|nr:hypothetical protein AKJ48_01435 [candidate division MSBL1 archaeon SCGC-AAA261O19]
MIYLDIETSAMEADQGMIIAIGLLAGEEVEVKPAVTREEEREALEWLNSKVGVETIVTWYGSEFDIPFLLTRAAFLNIDSQPLIEAPKLDLFKVCKGTFRLSSYSLRSVADFFGIHEKDRFTGKDVPTLFKLVEDGDEEAQKLIIEHCESDLQLLKRVHEWVKPYIESFGTG